MSPCSYPAKTLGPHSMQCLSVLALGVHHAACQSMIPCCLRQDSSCHLGESVCVSMSILQPRPPGNWYSDNEIHNIFYMLQELGYMSRRGHKTGIISTYVHTWLLSSVRDGCLKISPAIRHDTTGTSTTVSVTEVRQVAFAASTQERIEPQVLLNLKHLPSAM